MVTDELKSSLAQFVTFARSLKGDEKSEAQLFLDHFFRALGHGGVQEAGATLEWWLQQKAARNSPNLLWPDRVLIEMKSRGQNLEKHYDRAFEYWTHIVPKRPPYVILCNFDEFWIYDFNIQLFGPVDRIPLRTLAENWSAFVFLLPHRALASMPDSRHSPPVVPDELSSSLEKFATFARSVHGDVNGQGSLICELSR